jgi:hypothetical protein
LQALLHATSREYNANEAALGRVQEVPESQRETTADTTTASISIVNAHVYEDLFAIDTYTHGIQ